MGEDDPEKQAVADESALEDDFFADAELGIYRRMLERWEIALDSLGEAD